jgi:hypothetical protein
MDLACNIDKKGRAVRIIGGALFDVTGLATIGLGMLVKEKIYLFAGGTASVIGTFMIYEGLRGWCAVRAMGFRTPL